MEHRGIAYFKYSSQEMISSEANEINLMPLFKSLKIDVLSNINAITAKRIKPK